MSIGEVLAHLRAEFPDTTISKPTRPGPGPRWSRSTAPRSTLAAYGLQVRHLRPYRVAADREIELFAQLLGPLARQRDLLG